MNEVWKKKLEFVSPAEVVAHLRSELPDYEKSLAEHPDDGNVILMFA